MPKKENIYLIIIIIFAMFLIGCTNNSPHELNLNHLSRIDVEVIKTDGSHEEAVIIADEETIDVLRKTFREIKWEPNVEPKMARKEDIKAILFIRYDVNMPERLFEYQIWFNQRNGTATIISNYEKEGYGTLDKDNAQIVENILFNSSVKDDSKSKETTKQSNDKNLAKQIDVIETIAMIKENVNLGLTKEEIENRLGSDYQRIKASDDDSELWRYDFGKQVGYMSPDDEYDTGDIKGLKNGIIQAQLFISWDGEGIVNKYSALYLNSKDGRVYDYRVFPDGGEKEQAITK